MFLQSATYSPSKNLILRLHKEFPWWHRPTNKDSEKCQFIALNLHLYHCNSIRCIDSTELTATLAQIARLKDSVGLILELLYGWKITIKKTAWQQHVTWGRTEEIRTGGTSFYSPNWVNYPASLTIQCTHYLYNTEV